MTENTAKTPIHRLFDRLRLRIKEAEDEAIEAQVRVERLKLLEADMEEKHSELEPALKFYDEEFGRAEEAEETPEKLIEVEEETSMQRHKLPEAICHLLSGTDPAMTHLTIPEIATLLEDMRQRGELDTKAERITYDRTSKVVRSLTGENRLVKEDTKVGNRTVHIYRLAKEG